MSGDFWEPWSPKLGDRVRLHMSRECPFTYGAPPEDGCEGVVVDLVTHDYLASIGVTHGHRFEVRVPGRGTSLYAASELEPAS